MLCTTVTIPYTHCFAFGNIEMGMVDVSYYMHMNVLLFLYGKLLVFSYYSSALAFSLFFSLELLVSLLSFSLCVQFSVPSNPALYIFFSHISD